MDADNPTKTKGITGIKYSSGANKTQVKGVSRAGNQHGGKPRGSETQETGLQNKSGNTTKTPNPTVNTRATWACFPQTNHREPQNVYTAYIVVVC